MASVTAEARLIVNALALFGTKEEQERWLTTYLQARDDRIARQQRRVFVKTDPTTLVSGSSS